ncbi:Molybdenum cofactor guanylyltransferase (EC 2.7.7.77) [uncultured Gammaproteobacteria bacterium]|jgi:molybdenum cofactor guanylyltransferase/molybdopterin-guanine dinucleotide biosynthesis protein MobB|nr:Molybdenum cofactor guanylyltransferase (EC 2.7.7.77) [uncultured Gammaproteobacteria bacterium]
MSISNQQITAVILAGGRSSRMNGQDKGLIQLNQKPLIQYVIEVIENEVDSILINANRNQKRYQKFIKNPIIEDNTTNFQGPLAGFAKAMEVAKTPYLLVLPCDCPMIGAELLATLKTELTKQKAQICVAHDGNRLQPTFALLKTDLLSSLLAYLATGDRKIDLWYQQHTLAIADLSQYQDFFINLNTPQDYASLTQVNRIKNVPILGFAAFSGTGKTTLIIQLIKYLKQKNIRLAYLKHGHHNFEIDHKGKDSYECYHAGAEQVLISSADKFALINRYTEQELGLFALFEQLNLKQLDLILVEGFKREIFPKIELQRQALNHPNIFENDVNVIAFAGDEIPIECDRVSLDINDIEQIGDFILAYMGHQIKA